MHKQILKFFKKPEQKQYDKQQLKDGMDVEKEHSDNKDVQKIIAVNHIDEQPEYYKKLKIMERVKLADMKKLVKAEDLVDLTNKQEAPEDEKLSEDQIMKYLKLDDRSDFNRQASQQMTPEIAHKILDTKDPEAIGKMMDVHHRFPDSVGNKHLQRFATDPDLYNIANTATSDSFGSMTQADIANSLTDDQKNKILRESEVGALYQNVASRHPNIPTDIAKDIFAGRTGNGKTAEHMVADTTLEKHPDAHQLADAAIDSVYPEVSRKAPSAFDLTDQQRIKYVNRDVSDRRLERMWNDGPKLGLDYLKHVYETMKDPTALSDEGARNEHTIKALNHLNAPEEILKDAENHPNQEVKDHAASIKNQPNVSVQMNTGKLRELRHELDQAPNKELNKKDMLAKGFDTEALKVNHLLGPKGNLHHDALDRHIESQPKIDYKVKDDAAYGYNKETEQDNKLEDYMNDFDPDEHVNREDHFDYEKAGETHDANFEESDYDLDEKDFHHTPKEAEEMAERKGYASVKEFADDKGHTVDKKGNLFRSGEYNNELEDAREQHNQNFDSVVYMDNDRYMRPSYDDAVSEARQDYEDKFDPSEDSDEEETRSGEQRHSSEASKVFELQIHPHHIQELKNKGLLETFAKLHDSSHSSSHPATEGKGLGWVRHTGDADGHHIDEIQSDFVSKLNRKMSELKPPTEAPSSTDEATNKDMQDELAENKATLEKYKGVKKILFGEHEPHQVIHEAFLQHLRNKGEVGSPVHVWQAQPKAVISGQNTSPIVLSKRNFDSSLHDYNDAHTVKEAAVTMGVKINSIPIKPEHEQELANKLESSKSVQKTTKEIPVEKMDGIHRRGYAKHHGIDFDPESIKAHMDKTGNKYSVTKYSIPATLPVKFTEAYDKQPKKMGYKEGEYGTIPTQHGDHAGEKTWKQTLRKMEVLCR